MDAHLFYFQPPHHTRLSSITMNDPKRKPSVVGQEDEELSSVQKKAKGRNCGDLSDVWSRGWFHYRNYVDSACEDPDGDGDVDELFELLDIISKNSEELMAVDINRFDEYCTSESIAFRAAIPVLVSMAYLHLATHAISLGFDGGDESDMMTIHDKPPEEYLSMALKSFPSNAAAKSMLANYRRMNCLGSLNDICDQYIEASEDAHGVREVALAMLNNSGVQEENKEWIELLLLNDIAGSEYEDDDSDSSDNGEEEADSNKEGIELPEKVTESEVEATSSFMAAFLLSTMGRHEEAKSYLTKFNFTHRVHPDVWEGTKAPCIGHELKEMRSIPESTPASFRSDLGVLPQKLYENLCHVLRPDSAYWKESGYDHRGYFSYFLDLTREVELSPNNIIEDVIANHLLPLAKRTLSEEEGKQIVGAEWWTHHRPIQANMGHNLHFDTDESLLAEEKEITHPLVSSVLYLSGGTVGDTKKATLAGSTIVFDQTPSSQNVATRAWVNQPVDNSFMTFPGNYLHGVLPCPGHETNATAAEQPHRLTFMVGFWTRRVPEKMKERNLYGPCGPIPPATDEHTWVREIAKRNGQPCDKASAPKDAIRTFKLSEVSPAWEVIGQTTIGGGDRVSFEPPQALDHRFFVRNAPGCFRKSLLNTEESF